MKELDIAYKPHIYLARKSKNSKKYHLSVSVPVYGSVITSFSKAQGHQEDKYKDCDLYIVKVQKRGIESEIDVKEYPEPSLQFVGFTAEIKRSKKGVAVKVYFENDDPDGHTKDAIHKYDQAAEPLTGK